jgi:hypothetical protein
VSEAKVLEYERPEVEVQLPEKQEALQRYEDPSSVFLLSEQRDEAQILAALAGASTDEFVYQFLHDDGTPVMEQGKPVAGISIEGVLELRRLYGGIATRLVNAYEMEMKGELGIYCQVRGLDKYTGSEAEAAKFVPYMGTRRNGSKYPIRFALEVSQSKAERNCIRKLLPQGVIRTFIRLKVEGTKEVSAEMLGVAKVKGQLMGAQAAADEETERARHEPPNGRPQAPPQTQLSPDKMRTIEAAALKLERQDKRTYADMRTLSWYRVLLIAQGDMEQARVILKALTAHGDYEGYSSMEDPSEEVKEGAKASALQVAYGRVKAAYQKWLTAGEAENLDASEEAETPASSEATPDDPKAEIERRCKAKGIPVEAIKAAVCNHVKTERFHKGLWRVAVDEWVAVYGSARDRVPSAADQLLANKLKDNTPKEFFGAYTLARKDQDEEDALAALRAYTGIGSTGTPTPEQYAMGARLAADI